MFEIFDSRNVTDSMDSSMVETAGCWGCMFSSDKDQCTYNVEALKWSL